MTECDINLADTDYVSNYINDAKEEELLHGQNGTNIFARKARKSRPSLLDVSRGQWITANSRIMVLQDTLPNDSILHYLGYIAKVGELGTRYSSVLIYDKEYREDQAALGFP